MIVLPAMVSEIGYLKKTSTEVVQQPLKQFFRDTVNFLTARMSIFLMKTRPHEYRTIADFRTPFPRAESEGGLSGRVARRDFFQGKIQHSGRDRAYYSDSALNA